ncbi:MAG TPA: hypothetical protein VNM47_20705 [Terriglobia bacterium]|nr:hypothetical protein [Terriglobia bacterium]
MRRAEKLLMCVFVGMLCQPVNSGLAWTPMKSASKDPLATRISLPKVEKASVCDMASLALSVGQVPGGIVVAGSQSDQKEHGYSFRSPLPLREVLKTIVSSDDLYAWQATKGVVNVVPRRGVPPILKTRISEFNSQDLTTLTAAVTLLLRSPEVRKRRQELNYGEGFNRLQGYYAISKPGFPPKKSPEPLSIHVKNTLLFDALNALVSAHGHGVWIYREYSHPQGKHYFEVSITGE